MVLLRQTPLTESSESRRGYIKVKCFRPLIRITRQKGAKGNVDAEKG